MVNAKVMLSFDSLNECVMIEVSNVASGLLLECMCDASRRQALKCGKELGGVDFEG